MFQWVGYQTLLSRRVQVGMERSHCPRVPGIHRSPRVGPSQCHPDHRTSQSPIPAAPTGKNHTVTENVTSPTQVHKGTLNLKPWQRGQSGNPGGKPAGARNRLQGDFVRRLADDFERFGVYAIARVRRHDPVAYLRVIATLMPKEVTVTHDAIDDLSDDQLNAAITAVRAILTAQDPGAEESETGRGEPTPAVSALPQTG